MKPRHSEQIFLSPFAPCYIEVPLESKKAWKRTLPMISSLKHNTDELTLKLFQDNLPQQQTHKLYSQLTQDYSLLNNHGCIVNKKIKIISVHRNAYTLFNQAKGNWDLFEWLYLHWLSQLGQQMICQSLHASWSKLPLHQGNPPSCHQLGKP